MQQQVGGRKILNWLLSDWMAIIVIIVWLVFIFVILFSSLVFKNMVLKIISAALMLTLLISIPCIGHSDWNREYKLKAGINNLRLEDMTIYSDKNAVKEIIASPHPIQINTSSGLKIQNEGSTLFFTQVVQIEDKSYSIRMACYMYPLAWTPYQTWEVNLIRRA
ncbi:hypothetical protein ACFOLF_26440 [Paenibacillus sepulcri]|uniref:Uncharacterized protein n=1 Tax=Paenibacillus sepulcri TaxID=359917 RepID=A0ABS7BZU6_9BACL|nr:hypothetical protein [Paenibacillus sepulcri]